MREKIVLIDGHSILNRAFYGVPDLTRDSLAWLFGKTKTEIADALFPQIPLDERMRLLTISFDYENRYLETHPGKMYDGVVDTIRELSLRYPLFIVSNCQCGIWGKSASAISVMVFPKSHARESRVRSGVISVFSAIARFHDSATGSTESHKVPSTSNIILSIFISSFIFNDAYIIP